MKQLQFRIHRYLFKPSLLGFVITSVCIPLFINLGLWQYHKALQKQAVHDAFNQAKTDSAREFPRDISLNKGLRAEDWQFKKITVTGTYETQYQILLDNQVEEGRVGYHVVTPLKIENTTQYVLINRGWILGKDLHTDLPVFNTPTGLQTLTGQGWVPSKKIFSLEVKTNASVHSPTWEVAWQNMDMVKYQARVPFQVSALAIKLDSRSPGGGFVRNWQIPDERIVTNLGYAYQWFGFSLAAFFIFIYMSTDKIREDQSH